MGSSASSAVSRQAKVRRSVAPGIGSAIGFTPLDAAVLQARSGEAAALLKALAHPGRLLLLCQLVDSELGVSELGERSGIAQPSLSQQLGVLRAEGLVGTRRDGKRIVYRIASPAAVALLQTLHRLFCAPAPVRPDKVSP